MLGAQWLSGRVLDSRPKGTGFEPHRLYCILSLRKNINPSLVLVEPWKTRPFITERLLMGRKESNQTKKKSKNVVFLALKIGFVLTNSADPDEMPHFVAFHQRLHCLPKYPFK